MWLLQLKMHEEKNTARKITQMLSQAMFLSLLSLASELCSRRAIAKAFQKFESHESCLSHNNSAKQS